MEEKIYITGQDNALNDQVSMYPLQQAIEPYVNEIAALWWTLFVSTALFLLSKVFRAWRERNKTQA
jgi:hypothetical protein